MSKDRFVVLQASLTQAYADQRDLLGCVSFPTIVEAQGLFIGPLKDPLLIRLLCYFRQAVLDTAIDFCYYSRAVISITSLSMKFY